MAAVMLAMITLLFLDVSGLMHHWIGWTAKVQFVPAVLAVNVGIVAALAVLTFVCGRIYCSVICPLGIMQDITAHINRKKNRYRFSPEKRILRWGVFVLFVALLIMNVSTIAMLLEPYSTFGLIVSNLLGPLYVVGNNVLASIAEHYDSYVFSTVPLWIRSVPVLLTAVACLVVVMIFSYRGGRAYCNTICPVGTFLGFLSRYSLLKIHFDESKCRKCGLCAKNCKASAIDVESMAIDYSRCVVCGNCLTKCNFDSLSYGVRKKPRNGKVGGRKNNTVDEGRRTFLISAAVAATTMAMAQDKKKVDGGLAVIEDKVNPVRHTKPTPPGAVSAANLQKHCTGCQLCIAQCPNGVLRPNTDIDTFMQPTMEFDRGFCRPECNHCSEVCPTGAILPLSLADKSSTQIGHAVWIRKNCLPASEQVECGNCERHCPTGAIEMVPVVEGDDLSPYVPAVNDSVCIGCGACEYVCPARPFPAIYVEGLEVHKNN